MYKLKFLAVLIALCVQGCSAGLSNLPSAGVPVVDGCSWVRPVYLSTKDVLTDETARQVLVLNETWERVCSDGTDQVQTQVQTKSEPIKP